MKIWSLVLVAVLAFSGLCVALGVRTRLFAGLFFAGFTYLELLDQTLYLNHYYLVSLLAFMLIWLPADGTLSASNWLDPTRSIDTVPAWVLYALRFQIATVYIFAGFAKLNADWLWRAQPLRMWLSARSDLPWVGPWLNLEGVAYVASWGGAAFDLSIVGFLLWPRTRPWAFVAVVRREGRSVIGQAVPHVVEQEIGVRMDGLPAQLRQARHHPCLQTRPMTLCAAARLEQRLAPGHQRGIHRELG